MDEETRERGEKEEVHYVVFNSSIFASKGEDIRPQKEADTVYDEVKVQNGALEQMTPAGGNDQNNTFKCVALYLGILCVILTPLLITYSSYIFIENQELAIKLQESKENQSALLAYQDHLQAVVGNLTSANENLVMSHSNLSRSCDVLHNKTQDLRTELAKIKEANRLNLTCAQKTKEGQSLMCRPCDPGWVNGSSSCFAIVDDVNEGKTWAEARDDCRGSNADLVVIDNEEEQNLHNNSYSSTIDGKGYWVGLSDTTGNGTWSWVDGTDVTLRFWTRTNDTTSSPRCAITWNNGKPFGWSAVNCTAKNQWICEKKLLFV